MRSRRICLFFLLLLTLALAACGGGHTSTVTSTVTATVTVTATTTAASATTVPGAANAHRPPDFGRAPPGLHLRAIAPSKLGPTVEQWDDVTISLLPPQSEFIGAYANGLFANTTSARTAFPRATIKTISVTAGAAAQCVDIEPGDATPSEAHVFYAIARAAGVVKPCLYFPLTLAGDVNADLTAHGIARSSVWEWDAHWTGAPHIDQGFDGTQWTDHAFGRSLDESTLTAAFAGVPAGNPLHYSWLPPTRRTFRVRAGTTDPCVSQPTASDCVVVHARERTAARTWDAHHCVNPTHAGKLPSSAGRYCYVHRQHLLLLAGRVSHIAHHTPNLKHKAKRPRWGAVHYVAKDGHHTTLGGAFRELRERTLATKPITRW